MKRTKNDTIMSIAEYKKQFEELFKQLQDEHGKPKSVYIATNDICDDTGYCFESTPVCTIEF